MTPYVLFIKRFFFAALAAVLPVMALWAAVCMAGISLEAMGVHLYRSEADQQRNLNWFVVASIAMMALGGWLGYRKVIKRFEPPFHREGG